MAVTLQWLDPSFSLPSSIHRWCRWIPQGPPAIWSRVRWIPQNLHEWWSDPDNSVVDNVLWSFITAFESVALVSMLGFFFVFYGCTI